MRYKSLVSFTEDSFRHLTGVKRSTFKKMLYILKKCENENRYHGGKPNILFIEDRLLMTLEYLREYRTYFHIDSSYGISESSCYRNIKWIEDTLFKHPDFALPGKKALLKNSVDYDVILVDSTESPIERPKKNSVITTQVKRKDIP